MVADPFFYDVLGILPEANDEEIRRAYRKLALKWHPDKNPDNLEEATRMFQIVAEAFSILSCPDARRQYDECGRAGQLRGSNNSAQDVPFGQPFAGFHGGFNPQFADNIFKSFFGGNDPFSMFGGPFGIARGMGGPIMSPFPPMTHSSPMGTGFGFGFDPCAFGPGMQGQSFMSSTSSSWSGGGPCKSVHTTTTIQNGQRVSKTTTTITHADGRVETSTEDHTDGVPSLQRVEWGGGGGGRGAAPLRPGSLALDGGHQYGGGSGRRGVQAQPGVTEASSSIPVRHFNSVGQGQSQGGQQQGAHAHAQERTGPLHSVRGSGRHNSGSSGRR